MTEENKTDNVNVDQRIEELEREYSDLVRESFAIYIKNQELTKALRLIVEKKVKVWEEGFKCAVPLTEHELWLLEHVIEGDR